MQTNTPHDLIKSCGLTSVSRHSLVLRSSNLQVVIKLKLSVLPAGLIFEPFNPRHRACLPEQSLKAYNLTVKLKICKNKLFHGICKGYNFNFMCTGTPLKLILNALLAKPIVVAVYGPAVHVR